MRVFGGNLGKLELLDNWSRKLGEIGGIGVLLNALFDALRVYNTATARIKPASFSKEHEPARHTLSRESVKLGACILGQD